MGKKFKNSKEMRDFIEKLENENMEEARKRAEKTGFYKDINGMSSYKEKYLEMQDKYKALKEAIAYFSGSMFPGEDIDQDDLAPHQETNKPKKGYLREDKDLARIEETKILITNYLTEDPRMSITALSERLGMTRQGLYKNEEYKELIAELKNKKG